VAGILTEPVTPYHPHQTFHWNTDLLCFGGSLLRFAVIAASFFQMTWKKWPGDQVMIEKCQMIWVVFSCVGLVGNLTTDNFTNWINEKQSIPAFVLIQSEWCSYCRKLQPEWERVRSKYENDTGLLIADISLETDPSLCSLFPESGTPRFFWVTSGVNSSLRYLGSYSYSSFVLFIKKQTGPSVIPLLNREEYTEALQDHYDNSLFFLHEPIGNSTEVFLDNLTRTLEKHPVRFYRFNYSEFGWGQTVLMYQFQLTNETIYFENVDDLVALENFVLNHSIPSIFKVDAFTLKVAIESEFVLLFSQGVDVAFDENITRLSKSFPSYLRLGFMNCRVELQVCGWFKIRPYDETQLILMKPARNVYYKFGGGFSDQNVTAWLDRALRGKEKELGPGAGWDGLKLRWKKRMKDGHFRLRLGLAVLGFGALAVLAVLCIVVCKKKSVVETKPKTD
jgi:thiol-disulfide isomerase/thioredoxin